MSASQLICNRFRIDDLERDLLGRGGMGTVYRATDTHTRELVAVKVLDLQTSEVSKTSEVFQRFAREGEALRQLNHPNIVRMVAAVEEQGRHYLVMEYVPGGSLRDLLEKDRRLPVTRAVQIALDLADALTRAHRLGILHRDLKPENVLLAADGTPRLADFGLARLPAGSRLTQSGMLMGTVDYISPEACNGEAPDERADIWSFGVLLFEMLTGCVPFTGDTFAARLNAILTRPVPDLAQLAPDLPDALVDLVYRMLEKDPQQRIPSIRLVGAELEAVQKGREAVTPSRSVSAGTRFASPTPPAGVPTQPQVAHNLPLQTTPFVGRQAELVELARLLEDPSVRLVTIVGLGGMGKTRLAIEAGARQLERFAHDVHFVSLAGLEAVEAMVPATAQALGLQFYEGREPRQQLLDYLREKRLLLIYDNFEHLLACPEPGPGGAVGLVSDILHAARCVRVMSTSRLRLGLPDEHLFHLAGMEFPEWETPADAADRDGRTEYSAVKLFVQGARRARPGFDLAEEDLKHVARICRLVDGMPLGILLAAAWLEMLTPAEIAVEMERSLDVLATDLPGVDARQRSVRAVLDYSWQTLTEPERVVFRGLSVFRGGFTREAAQAVTGAGLRELMGLVNKSLLSRAPAGRYDLHELLRQYGAEKLAEAPEEERAACDCHCAYYANLLHHKELHLFGKGQRTVLAEIGEELDNVRAGWEWAVAQDRIEWIDNYVESLGELYQTRGWYQEGARLLAHAAHGLSVEKDTAGAAERVLGKVLSRQGRLSAAFDAESNTDRLFDASVVIFRRLGARRELAYALCYHGGCESAYGNAHGAPLCQEAFSIFGELGDKRGMALALRGLAWVALHQADYPLAKRRFGESVALLKALEDQKETAHSLGGLGYICYILGEYQTASKHHREMLELCTEMGDQRGIACATGYLGIDAFGMRDFEHAQKLWQASLALYRDIADPAGMADELGDMGELANLRGEYAQAAQFAQEALACWRTVYGDLITWSFTWPLRVLGNAMRGLGDLPAARRTLRQSLEQASKIQRWGHSLTALVGVAALLADEGKVEYALEVLYLVMGHRASWQMAKDQAAPLSAQLEEKLPPSVVAVAQERGRARDLDATVAELLAGLAE